MKKFFGSKSRPPTPPPAPVIIPACLVSPVITGTAIVGQTVTCSTGTWSNSPTSFTFQWQRNGVNISGQTASTYELQNSTDVGVTIMCVVTATNAAGSVSANSNAIIPTALTGAPVNLTAPALSGTAQNGQTLFCNNGTWSNSPTSFTYQWLRDGANITGATTSSYLLTQADVGTLISCRVTATNGAGSASATSNTATPIDIIPSSTVAPAVTGSTSVGSVLSCTTGTWTHSPTSYSYQWQRAGVNIGGATASSYTIVSGDSGQALRCVVTATNSGGSASANSNEVTAGASAPVNTVAPVVTGDAIFGQTLFSSTGTWTGSPTSYAYQWYDNLGAIPLATSNSMIVDDSQQGKTVYCVVTATNSNGSTSANSNTKGPIADIDLTNAITAFTRTSSSGVTPMTWSVTFGGNVYQGYTLRAKVFSDSALSTLVQNVAHVLTYEDLQSGATLDLAADGFTAPGATDWLQLTVEAMSPGMIFHSYTYNTAISPTDATAAMTFSSSDKTSNSALSGGNLVLTGTQGGGWWATARSSRRIPAGSKVYAEFGSTAPGEFGVCDGGVAFPGPGPQLYWGSSAFGQVATDRAVGWAGNDNQLYYNNTFTTIGAYAPTDIVCVAWDDTNEKIWFRKNNTAWLPSGDPAAGTGGFSAPGLNSDHYFYAEVFQTASTTANFGTTPGGTAGFTYTPPSGFVAA